MKVKNIGKTEEYLTELGLENSTASLVAKGALLLVVRSGILKHTIPVAMNSVPVALNQDMKALRVEGRRLSARYLMYVVEGKNNELLQEWAKQGATVESIEQEYLENSEFPVPALREQSAIANFLDHETAKIDTLIEKQQQLIKLLKEKRQAVISHAVTKGLNPDAPMKDSGVEWLGEVPEGWDVLPLRRFLLTIQQGSSPIASDSSPVVGEFGVLKISAVKKGSYFENHSKTLQSEAEYESRFSVKKGDLLVTRANTPELVADACIVSSKPKLKVMLCDLIYRLNLAENINPEYLCYWLLSHLGRSQIEMDARGSSMTMAKVSQGHIRAWLATSPPLDEQREIVEYLDTKCGAFLDATQQTDRTLRLLKERRTALISAAVTGKIDVRNWQPPKSESTASTDA